MTAFVFDLDGTLVDSVYQHVLAWREALEKTGIELARSELVMAMPPPNPSQSANNRGMKLLLVSGDPGVRSASEVVMSL